MGSLKGVTIPIADPVTAMGLKKSGHTAGSNSRSF